MSETENFSDLIFKNDFDFFKNKTIPVVKDLMSIIADIEEIGFLDVKQESYMAEPVGLKFNSEIKTRISSSKKYVLSSSYILDLLERVVLLAAQGFASESLFKKFKHLNSLILNIHLNIKPSISSENKKIESGFLSIDERAARKIHNQFRSLNVVLIDLEAEINGFILSTRRELFEKYVEIDNKISQSTDQTLNLKDMIDIQARRLENLKSVFSEKIDFEINSTKNKINDVVSSINADTQSRLNGMLDECLELIKRIEKHEKDASKSVTLLSSATLSDGYSKMSKEEKIMANWWTGGTMVLLLIAASIGAATIYELSTKGMPEDPWVIVFRLVAALLVIMPAIYTAREASRHRKHSDQSRKVSLELAVLSPFISQMSVEKQNEIREALICKYFLGSSGEASSENVPIVKEVADKVVSACSNTLDKVVDKIGSGEK